MLDEFLARAPQPALAYGNAIVDCNQAAAVWLDLSNPDQLIGRATATLSADLRALDDHGVQPLVYECEIQSAIGRTLVAEVSSLVVTKDAATVVIAVLRDVTTHRRAQTALLRLASFPEQEPNPVIELDLAGAITFANSCANGMFPSLLTEGGRHPLFASIVQRAAEIVTTQEPVTEHAVTFGESTFDLRACPVPGLPLVRVFVNDVSHLRATQIRLEQSIAELSSTRRKLIDASRQAGRSEVAISVLHDIGNAMTSVRSGAARANATIDAHTPDLLNRVSELLTSEPISPERITKAATLLARLAEKERDTAQRLTATLTELERRLDHVTSLIHAQQRFAKGGDGAREACTPRELIDEALEIALANSHEMRIDAEIRVDSNCHYMVDRHKVLQILINVFGNARDAMAAKPPDDRTLRIRCAEEGELLVFETIDNGAGITADVLSRLFTHGFTTKPDGHGFGLHSCACAAMEMKGKLTAHSDGLGTGARFRLELPRQHADPAAA